jgi:hypothetical protein
MPRTVTALSGAQSSQAQFPVSLVAMQITGAYGPFYINDVDVTLYLNTTTDSLSMVPTAGYTEFVPYADLKVPVIEASDSSFLSQVTLSLSNVDETFYGVLADNNYRDVQVDIWQGNLSLAVGNPPDDVASIGAIRVYTGRLDQIVATHKTATLTVLPHVSPFQMTIPFDFWTLAEIPTLPVPGKVLKWGY